MQIQREIRSNREARLSETYVHEIFLSATPWKKSVLRFAESVWMEDGLARGVLATLVIHQSQM